MSPEKMKIIFCSSFSRKSLERDERFLLKEKTLERERND